MEKKKITTICLPPSIIKEGKKLAKKKHRSFSGMIEMLIREDLENTNK